ncbi:DMT family transporter [Bacillus sp. FJAT-29790]|uniref:DMT family transporter n=1 Tax=Bacillus sp. FJAT-29790 TaxID=1895002 RepID=UPI001C21ADA9|nr:DMT family transporter [Bacillus sp. FJAT-29790]MBU8877647.1 DMT family transporter [Bacillus sp. FJAT-29790]
MGKLYSTLILLSIIWGTSFLFIKILLEDMGPAAVVFGRCIFGFVTLAILALIKHEKIAFKELPWKKLFLVGFLNNALPWLFISTSEMKISSSLASILNATTPIWTLIIGSVFFASALKRNQWIGIAFGFVGIFIISDIKPGELLSGNLSGVLLILGGAICYGAGAHLTKRYLLHLSTLHISLFTLFVASIISFVMMMVMTPVSIYAFKEISVILPLIGLGSLGSGLAYLLYYFLVKKGSPEFASLVTYLAPASAIIWGAFILEEEIHVSMILGLLIIFAGIYIASLKRKKAENKAAA